MYAELQTSDCRGKQRADLKVPGTFPMGTYHTDAGPCQRRSSLSSGPTDGGRNTQGTWQDLPAVAYHPHEDRQMESISKDPKGPFCISGEDREKAGRRSKSGFR